MQQWVVPSAGEDIWGDYPEDIWGDYPLARSERF